MLDVLERKELVNRVEGLIHSQSISEELNVLGEGLNGRVFEIDDYAVKVFKDSGEEKRDYKILSRLEQDPFFPKLFHYDKHNYMIVEKVKGLTISQYLMQGGKINSKHRDQVDRLFEGLYGKRILPSDLHLNNIMINENEQIKIVDVGRFGIVANADLQYHTQLNQKKNELLKRIDLQYFAGSP